ncbi:hypothetical protein A9Q84_05530 [Halobacteriovorax marinus]|uniref:Uncharacterized protein n=1 Tax=Halobacteriovorax marinus TaxID=97084 RepID=A0A1Y5FF78_9BACT|nr:hypothetical protein A9Q84_05530 [Halobacteriovorax marinus]
MWKNIKKDNLVISVIHLLVFVFLITDYNKSGCVQLTGSIKYCGITAQVACFYAIFVGVLFLILTIPFKTKGNNTED